MALNTDIAPTILSYAGAKVPVHYQGHNLQPIVNGNSPNDWRKDTFCEHLMENAIIPKWEGVRSQRYVYARYFQQEPPYEYLHDLRKDPDLVKESRRRFSARQNSQAPTQKAATLCAPSMAESTTHHLSPTTKKGAKPDTSRGSSQTQSCSTKQAATKLTFSSQRRRLS
ncbi:MAG: hypothetical protein CM1200mP29_10260 [Verrucomicrobiota bacterium]|nr:MAG: hypothetical protein CM1200mP29_10260 [Verrucomicrobiota bacterium]